ncbi:MAG: hypothetical protein ACREOZ_01615, partial [Gloeomargaritales cyanobacterium]
YYFVGQQRIHGLVHNQRQIRPLQSQRRSVLQFAMLATVGDRSMALTKVSQLSENVFTSAGGSGHSLSNTLWYISTRPDVEQPLDLTEHLASDDAVSNTDIDAVRPARTGKNTQTVVAKTRAL